VTFQGVEKALELKPWRVTSAGKVTVQVGIAAAGIAAVGDVVALAAMGVAFDLFKLVRELIDVVGNAVATEGLDASNAFVVAVKMRLRAKPLAWWKSDTCSVAETRKEM
jgi:hypothetical protein